MSSNANNIIFSNESERGVISGILHDPNERMDIVVEQVPEGAFYHLANLAAFEVLQDMRRAGTPIDPVTFTNRARELAKLDAIGGEAAINDLYAHRPPGHHFMAYLRTLKEKRAARLVIEVCDRFREMAYTPGTDPAEMVDLFQKDALTINLERDERGPRHISEVLASIDAQIDKRLEMLANNQQIAGYPFGLPRLDHLCQGLEPEDRLIIAGLSNTGKTALLVQMVRSFIEQGLPGLVFMLDGSAESFVMRLYAAIADVPQNHLKTGFGLSKGGGPARDRLKQARAYLEQQGIFIDDRPALSIQQITSKTRRLAKTHGIKWNAIDFFGNGTVPGFAPNDKVGMLTAFSKAWKQGVLDMVRAGLPVPSILLAQVVADQVDEGEIPPCAPHIIKDCKAAYEDATKVIALSREFRDLPTLKEKELRIPDSDRNAAPPLAEGEQIIVATMAKSKDGALGNVWLRMKGDVMQWSDINPHSRLADSSINKAARLKRHEEQGGPPPVAPPKPRIGTGPSMYGPLKITRPDRPPQKGEYMQAPKEDEP